MDTVKIVNRYNEGHVLFEGDPGESLEDAIARATSAGVCLGGANLRCVDLSGVDLSWGDFRGADFDFSILRGTNLEGADLDGASLFQTDLTGANLDDADFYNADIRSATLKGARLNWNSHDLLSEILFRDAEKDAPKRMVAGLIAVSTDWCWNRFLDMQVPPACRKWALETLASYVVENDDHPAVLDKYVAKDQAPSAPSGND